MVISNCKNIIEATSMKTWIVQNPDGYIYAIFKEKGEALSYCHTHSLPLEWILEGEVNVKIKGSLGYGR